MSEPVTSPRNAAKQLAPNKKVKRKKLAFGQAAPTPSADTRKETQTKTRARAQTKEKSTGINPNHVRGPRPNDPRYKKQARKPLTDKEQKFLTEFYYEKSGYAGRDVLYKQLQAHYDKNDTPAKERISRRRMWEFFLDLQEVSQLHRPAKKSSIAIKPINALKKLDRAQADLIIRGGDSLRKFKGILCVIDVATRRAWTEVLTSTTSKAVAEAFDKILERVYESLTDEEKKRRNERDKNGKSKTFTILQTDNGAEFKKDFAARTKELNIKQVYGVSQKSTSQSLIERFNQTLQGGMERERTATGNTEWHTLVQKHTDFYNDKTNRNLRLKDPSDPKATFKTYTPNELWKEKREVLRGLFDNKNKDLAQSNKDDNKEAELKVGGTVRIVDFGKRKGALSKGFKQSWSKELYTIFKLKRPKESESSRPVKFYVRDKQSGKQRKDANGRLIPYTVNDLQKIRGEVQKAPASIRVGDTPPPSPPTTPRQDVPAKPKAKQPAPEKKAHKYVGVKIKTEEDGGDEGEVVEVFSKKVAGKRKQYARIKWKKPFKQDKEGKDVYIQDQPISAITAYLTNR